MKLNKTIEMKNSRFPKIILTLGMLFNFALQVNSEIIPITNGASPKHLPASAKSTSDGLDDGTLICWLDQDGGGSLYVQKIDPEGQLQWGADGVILDRELGLSFDPGSDYPMIYSDNLGGALVIYGKSFPGSREIYASKIYFNGIISRIPVCITPNTGGYNYNAVSALTKDNCLALTWENFSGGDFNIYSQKINFAGDILWNEGKEVPVCIEAHDQRKPTITCDESNSIVITWLDGRRSDTYPEFSFDLFANRLSSEGTRLQKDLNGKFIFSHYEIESKLSGKEVNKIPESDDNKSDNRKMIFYNHNIISSGKNSTIIAIEHRDRDFDSFIKIIKLDENLNNVWLRIVDENSFQSKPLLTGDGNHGAYIFWNDNRNSENSVYGIGLNANGIITLGNESGVKVSCDGMKDSFSRTLPSDKNQNGICSEANKFYISWVTSGSDNLILSSVNPQDRNGICSNATDIINNVSGECTSITTQRNNVVVVFKKSQNIYAWRKGVSSRAKEDIKNKITIDNFPNPFNPVTKINFTLPLDGFVKLNVYDITGRIVKSLINEFKTSGEYSINFDAGALSSGVYFYKIESNGWIETKKTTLIK